MMIIKTQSMFLVIFLTLFFWGPKINGWIDLSLILPAILSFVLVLSKRSKVSGRIFLILILLVIFEYFIFLRNNFPGKPLEFEQIFYLARAIKIFLKGLVLYVFLKYVSEREPYEFGDVVSIISWVLSLNAIMILLSLLLPDFAEILARIVGYDKSIQHLRFTGLTAGFDVAGFFCGLTCVFLILNNNNLSAKEFYILLAINIFATFFTSRLSVVMLTSLLVLTCIFDYRRIKLYIFPLSILSVFGFFILLPLLANTIVELREFHSVVSDYSVSYSQTSVVEILERMWFFPDDWSHLWFGNGEIVHHSDIGYVQIVFYGGWFLVFVYLLFYLSPLLLFKEFKRCQATHSLWMFLKVFVVFMLVANLKESFFLMRHINDLFLVALAALLIFSKKQSKLDAK